MVHHCVSLQDFDMIEFVAASLALSIVSYIWVPPGSENIRVDTRNPPSQSQNGWDSISAVFRWADRTDPGAVLRNAFYKRMWDEREPGQEIVVIDDKIMSRTALQMSLE